MHQCPVCPKAFPTPYKLQRHHVIHTGQKPFSCKICGKAFTQSDHLKSHLEKVHHSGSLQDGTQPSHDKPSAGTSTRGRKITHRCPKCLKTFCAPSKLQRHFLIHTGQKPYSCRICFRTFRQKVHLKSHLCTENDSTSAIKAKKRQKLGNDSQASIQQPQSSLQRPTSHHTTVNSSVELELQCKISVNTVKTESKLDAVVKSEQPLNTSNQCLDFCHKSDEQESLYLTQNDTKPFLCTICGRLFQLEVDLLHHQKIHRDQKELGSPTPVQNSNDVKMSDSEGINGLPEPSHADRMDLNIIVKPETWSEDCNDSVPQEAASFASAEQQRETCHGTSKRKRIKTSHQCRTCSKCFPSASKLQRHMLTHTGQRPFGCETCGKRFRQKTHLRVHCRTHLLSRYQKQRSLYINRPPSRTGGFNTRTAADIPIEEIVVHRKDIEMNAGRDVISVRHLDQTPSIVTVLNNVKRESEDKLLPHTSKKNAYLRLRKVSKGNVKRTGATKSKQNPHDEQNKCFQCLKCFPSASKLQRHEMVHTGLKPFQCPSCGKTFRQASHLKTHARTHCKRKPSKPFNLQVNIRKLKTNSQEQLYPRITVRIPPQNKSVNANTTHSVFDGAVGKVKSVLICTKREMPIRNVNSRFKTNTKRDTSHEKNLHICRICCKNFASPYKLSRHSVTHSGIRPYQCTLCSKTFTQRGHLTVHEHRCRKGNKISDNAQREMMNTNHLQGKCTENLNDRTDFKVDVIKEQIESHGYRSYCKEAIDDESEKKQRENYNQANKQNQIMAAPPLSHQYEGNKHNREMPCQRKRGAAISGGSKLLRGGLVSSVVENQIQADYWCEPVTVFECDKCSASFMSENERKQHICAKLKVTESAQKNSCDICLKDFSSPSKLKRHCLIHTGQRPFRCDVCGKTFTQLAHVRTHRLTH